MIYKTCSEDGCRVMDAFGVFSKPCGPVEIEFDEAEFGCGSWVESEIPFADLTCRPQETYF